MRRSHGTNWTQQAVQRFLFYGQTFSDRVVVISTSLRFVCTDCMAALWPDPPTAWYLQHWLH